MRRDICYFYNARLIEVYNAYIAAIKTVFHKDCSHQPYHNLSFGLNFSMKYNMNGGSCNVHFMPWHNGTAVNVRYSIIQAAGARYGAHCEAMNRQVELLLQTNAVKYNIPVETFLEPANCVTSPQDPRLTTPVEPMASAFPAQPTQPQYRPPVQPQPAPPQPVPAPAGNSRFCPACGTQVPATARFCHKCGTQQPV